MLLLLLVLLAFECTQVSSIAPPAPTADIKAKKFYKTFNESEWILESDVDSAFEFDIDEELPETGQGNARRKLATNINANTNTLATFTRDTGYLRVLVVLVRFADHQNKSLPVLSEIQTLFNGEGSYTASTPTGSIRDWIKANSNGRLKMEAEVVDWTLTNNTERYFASDENQVPVAGITHEMQYAMYPVLDQLDSRGFNFSRFDGNNDGYIDLIVLLHSGYAAELGNKDCNTNATYESRIWSHAVANFPPNPWISKSTGIKSNGYAVGSGVRGYCYNRVPRLGVITHEMMHTFGLPDLNDNKGDFIGRGLGDYDIMSNPYGRTGSQAHPGFLSPWSKMKVNWLDPILIENDGFYNITASELTNQTYIIRKGYPDDEYILIENRQPVLWDLYMWTGGLLIWHIDNTGDRMRNRGYPGQIGWPGNGNHYQIAIEAADRQYHLEVGTNNGDDGDFWRAGKEYAPGSVATSAANNSLYPNSNSYKSGFIQATRIRIYGISPSQGTMSFRVEGLDTVQVTIAPTTVAPVTEAPGTIVTIVPTTSAPVTVPPAVFVPLTAAPTTISPTTLVPVTQVPTTQAPITPAPVTATPTTLAPTTSAPVTTAPTTLTPTTSAPITAAPTTLAPTTSAPITAAPTTLAPTTSAPITAAPTTQAPITPAPVTAAPTTQAPITSAPVTATPTTLASTTSNPVTVAPTSQSPITPAPDVSTAPNPVEPTTFAPVKSIVPLVANTSQPTIALTTLSPIQNPTKAPVTANPTNSCFDDNSKQFFVVKKGFRNCIWLQQKFQQRIRLCVSGNPINDSICRLTCKACTI